MKPIEKITSHCEHCDYPIFTYHHICPMCSKTIEKAALSLEEEKTATTRFDFWFASLKRTLGTRPRDTASFEL